MRKIAIIGASITEDKLPDDTWEKWCLNNLYRSFPNTKFDRWFELHDFERKNNQYIRRSIPTYSTQPVYRYMKDIDKLNCPVFMQKKWKIIKQSVKYPFKEIFNVYGNYFGCSFAYMAALALYEHQFMDDPVTALGFYGISLTGKEYYRQRPTTEYYIGIAVGMGILVHIDPASQLLKVKWPYALKENHTLIEAMYFGLMDRLMYNILTPIQEGIEDFILDEQLVS